jgi:hypothetical protein
MADMRPPEIAASNGQKKTVRMRLVGWNVQPVLMADDGDNLTSVQVSAYTVPAAEWEAFKTGGDERALQQLRQQIEGEK